MFIVDLFESRCRLEAKNLFLRHQLSIACAAVTGRCWYGCPRLWPRLLGAAQVVQPDTILRWHHACFKRSGGEIAKEGWGGQISIRACVTLSDG
jgi:hypothetical protein